MKILNDKTLRIARELAKETEDASKTGTIIEVGPIEDDVTIPPKAWGMITKTLKERLEVMQVGQSFFVKSAQFNLKSVQNALPHVTNLIKKQTDKPFRVSVRFIPGEGLRVWRVE